MRIPGPVTAIAVALAVVAAACARGTPEERDTQSCGLGAAMANDRARDEECRRTAPAARIVFPATVDLGELDCAPSTQWIEVTKVDRGPLAVRPALAEDVASPSATLLTADDWAPCEFHGVLRLGARVAVPAAAHAGDPVDLTVAWRPSDDAGPADRTVLHGRAAGVVFAQPRVDFGRVRVGQKRVEIVQGKNTSWRTLFLTQAVAEGFRTTVPGRLGSEMSGAVAVTFAPTRPGRAHAVLDFATRASDGTDACVFPSARIEVDAEGAP